MNVKAAIRKATKENPEIPLVLDIARRAREIEERQAPQMPLPPPTIGANPVTAQGVILLGHVLNDE